MATDQRSGGSEEGETRRGAGQQCGASEASTALGGTLPSGTAKPGRGGERCTPEAGTEQLHAEGGQRPTLASEASERSKAFEFPRSPRTIPAGSQASRA